MPVCFTTSSWTVGEGACIENRTAHGLWGAGSFSLFDAPAVQVAALTGCVMQVFGWWFEVVLSGWFLGYLPSVVVDVVVAA